MKNARQMPQRKFRFPEELIALIDRAADENRRSANAEVVYRLEQSFKGKRMDSNEIIAMFDECTLPLSKARSLLRMIAVAINSRDPIHQEHLISGIEVIEELMEEGLKGLDVGLHQWSDAPAAATAKASSTIPATNEEKDHV